MEQTTLDADQRERHALSARDRAGAWLYTGAPGRLVSFSIDLGLSLAALGLWSSRRLWRRLGGDHSA
ncbi:MAG TPA: hypothetical protein VFN72_11615 [Solirubrobacterales bacterium]|nr:hypothetical protein [Solirubrobacterales bacterium]